MKKSSRNKAEDAKVELAFLEKLRARLPNDIELLKALGDLYTKVGRHQEGLEIDVKLTAMAPYDPVVCYNLACSHALVGDADSAIMALGQAIRLGYRDFEWMAKDPDLDSLRGDERFKALVSQQA